MKAMAEATPGGQTVMPCKLTWIEVRLIDADKHPVPGESYRIQLPDASIVEGTLDHEGKVRIEGIVPGQCLVSFPKLHASEWRRA